MSLPHSPERAVARDICALGRALRRKISAIGQGVYVAKNLLYSVSLVYFCKYISNSFCI